MIQAIENRNILSYKLKTTGPALWTRKHGNVSTDVIALSGLRDGIKSFEARENPKDIERELRLISLSFKGCIPFANIIGRNGVEETLPMTKTAFQQLLSFIPGINYRDMHHHWTNDEHGKALSSVLFAYCALQQVDRDLFIRTAERSDVGRCVRSVHASGSGNSYSPYGSGDMLDALIESAPEFANSIVLSADMTDDRTRLRLASPKRNDDGSFSLMKATDLELRSPVSTLSFRNSSTGKSSVSIEGGIWTLICNNGMTSNSIEQRKSRKHVGDMSRHVSWYNGAIESILTKQYGMLEQYETALNTQIDDMVGWMDSVLQKARSTSRYSFLNDHIIEKVKTKGLNDATTPQNSSVAQGAQAVALIAQDMKNIGSEILMEELADWTMRQGLGQSVNSFVAVEA